MTEPTGQQPYDPAQPPAYQAAPPLPTYQAPAAPGYPTPTGPGYPQPAYYQQPYQAAPPTNQKALIAMILGLVGFLTWITSIPAIILGHMAKKEIERTGEPGHGMAMTGLITGYIVAIGGIIAIVAYVIFIVALVSSSGS